MNPEKAMTSHFDARGAEMNRRSMLLTGMAAAWLAALGLSIAAQDKYNVKVPGGLAFGEFKGYESWETISISRDDKVMAVIVGNQTMIDAYKAGIPANGKPVPDGAKMAKVHWIPKRNQFFPDASVPGDLLNVDFMVKDSKRFADSGGWGYAVFDYNAATDTFTPGTNAGSPPQGNDAKCGFACHTVVKSRDYVFTEYGKR
jgi:Cytochrome P460